MSQAVVPCPSLALTATRSYLPPAFSDGVASVSPVREVAIPAFLPVTQGNAGNHRAVLTFTRASGGPLYCIYQGGSAGPVPVLPGQVAAGRKYLFQRCVTGLSDLEEFLGGLLNPLHAGDRVVASAVRLRIVRGSAPYGTTQVSLALETYGACTAPSDASTDAPVDAPSDAPDVVDAGDVVDVQDVVDASDAGADEGPDAADVVDVSDVADAADVADAVDAQDPADAPDAPVDAALEAGADAAEDTGEDVVVPPGDAPVDAPVDGSEDAGEDAFDGGDSAADAPVDVTDAPVDSNEDGSADTGDADASMDGGDPVLELHAPPLDRTVGTGTYEAISFLFTGPDAVQTGVAPGAITRERAVAVRGRVLDAAGAPLVNATVSIAGHAEYGSTRSRADGVYDLAVAGGGRLTVRVERAGHFPVDRAIDPAWDTWVTVPDVVLRTPDTAVTEVELSTEHAAWQVARQNPVTDSDGTRRATVLFAPGTTATLETSSGTVPLPMAHVRATEFTVGALGRASMPGELPPASGYTYALELSVDEAPTTGFSSVHFSAPVAFYVENFLAMRVGTVAPVGSYDTRTARWVAEPNGRVIKILAVDGGAATLDTDGDTVADDDTLLASRGITLAERQQLALLYAAGTELWRAPLEHFTAVDINWPFVPPPDAQSILVSTDNAPWQPDPTTCPRNSTLSLENQTLGEQIPLAGTPFTLHYESGQSPGSPSYNSAFRVTLVDDGVPNSGGPPAPPPGTATLVIEIAGQHIERQINVSPTTPTVEAFRWNGLDRFGRRAQGAQRFEARGELRYPARYVQPDEAARFFGQFPSGYLTNPTITSDRSREEIVYRSTVEGALGGWDSTAEKIGGWSIDAQHHYHSNTRMLLRGDGTRRPAESWMPVLSHVRERDPNTGELQHALGGVALDMGADGTIYLLDFLTESLGYGLYTLAPDGTRTLLVGANGTTGSTDDNIPALQAEPIIGTGYAWERFARARRTARSTCRSPAPIACAACATE